MNREERNKQFLFDYTHQKMSQKEIAEKYGYSQATVHKALSKMDGYNPRTSGDYSRKYDEDEILAFITKYYKENYRSPSMNEIGEEFGMGKGEVVTGYIDRLEKEGKLKRVGGHQEARSFVPAWLIELIDNY